MQLQSSGCHTPPCKPPFQAAITSRFTSSSHASTPRTRSSNGIPDDQTPLRLCYNDRDDRRHPNLRWYRLPAALPMPTMTLCRER
jgi:hypothetical protein